ncbi:hypothetical protein ACWEOZ_06865 [Actinoplanes sp. NPDC004185]
MTGDAPQPGETSRDDGSPWSHADPASPWWRADEQDTGADRPHAQRRRTTPAAAAAAASSATPTLDPPPAAQHTGEAAEAHRAGAEDVRAALTGEAPRPATAEPGVREPAAPRHAQPQQVQPQPPQGPQQQAAEPKQAAPAKAGDARPESDKATEQNHDRVDSERFNTAGEGTVYATRNRVRPAEPQRDTTIVDALTAVPVEPPQAEAPEVMVLPEPDRNRPTVALDRTAVPGQPPSGLSRLGRTRHDPARADRALQDRVRQERTAALLETSPFWKAEEERRALSAPPAEAPEKVAEVRQRARRRAPEPRRPAAGLVGLLALGLIATFFAWVSAEPFWLAVGHGDRGSATVTRCTGSGVSQRCTGQFTAANGTYRVDRLALFGIEPAQRAPGTSAPARMVSSDSRQAYAGDTGVLVHLRWALSFVLVLLCGLGIAALTGARRLETARARRAALLVSLAGPLVLLAGFLYVTY